MSETYIARGKAVAARSLGGETIIMSVADSTVYALDELATILWKAADGKTPLARIVQDRICSDYEVTHETALRDAEELCQELAENKVLLISNQPILNGETQP